MSDNQKPDTFVRLKELLKGCKIDKKLEFSKIEEKVCSLDSRLLLDQSSKADFTRKITW